MPSYSRKTTALSMFYRPNPVMFMHQLLARRDCIHLDLFASIRAGKPDSVLWTLELRSGGRGEPVETHYWQCVIGSTDEPHYASGREAQYYTHDDRIRFNTRSAGEHHIWARWFHHSFMAPILTRDWTRRKYAHTSRMCHYWHVYDLPPFPSGFTNMYATQGKGFRGKARKGALEQ